MSTRIITGDSLTVLRTLEDQSAQTCVTSPPYYGLRDYGVDGQIGLEDSPDEYVDRLVEVFREVRRVLRDDGTLWLNLGDSYCSTDKWGGGKGGNTGKQTVADDGSVPSWNIRAKRPAIDGVKPKNLLGMPWRVAFALQADGWYLRQDIIWSKPNPMPESVTDRCTKAHEYLFLLSKSERYYFDQEAIKEPVALTTVDRLSQPNLENQAGSDRVPGKTNGTMKAVGKAHIAGNETHRGTDLYNSGDERHRTKAGLVDFATRQRSARDNFKRENSKRAEVFPGQSMGTHRPDRDDSSYDIGTRNKRSVWTVATQPFKEAHFATFPPALIEPCILAGCMGDGVVLDPFGGAGTTAVVANRLQRKSVLIELNPDYAEMARQRVRSDGGLFAGVAA